MGKKKNQEKASKPEKNSNKNSNNIKNSKQEDKTDQNISNQKYKSELAKLQIELVKLQRWVQHKGLRVMVLFEGRDAAGKGGAIKRISETLNPRVCKVVALATPSDRERTQWYFQRYVAHFPSAGEIVLFDRSWYNRAGVEKVMGFCTYDEYNDFMRSCPQFEIMIQRAGIILIKYWFSVSDEEQEKRFQERIEDPTKRWKISPMDLHAREKWVDYSKAKDDMFAATDIPESPWNVVQADDKKRARLNFINHLLTTVPYEDLPDEKIQLPPRQKAIDYERPPLNTQNFVPEEY
jgi:polyphosphate kinase